MWIRQPANRPQGEADRGPIGHLVPERTVRVDPALIAALRPGNDPGLPPAGRSGASAVLLVCTGTDAEGLRLDVVLSSRCGDTVLASGIGERDAIAEARKLAALYGARLAMLSLNGHMVELEEAPVPSVRRRGSPLGGRRPRFLVRRKTGIQPVRQAGGESGAALPAPAVIEPAGPEACPREEPVAASSRNP